MNNELDDVCDDEVFENGRFIALYADRNNEEMERLCKAPFHYL